MNASTAQTASHGNIESMFVFSQSAKTHDFHGRLAPRQQVRVVFVRTDKDDGHTAAIGTTGTTGTTATGIIAIATGIITTGIIGITTGIIATDDRRGALREVENAQKQLDGAGRARARKEHDVVLAAADALSDQLARLGSVCERERVWRTVKYAHVGLKNYGFDDARLTCCGFRSNNKTDATSSVKKPKPEQRGLLSGDARRRVRVAIRRQNLVDNVLLDEVQRAAGRGVVGVGDAART
jgi:hypothetical protein